MAVDRTSPWTAPLWNGRMVEWCIVAAVVLVLIGLMERQVQVVRGRGEFAAVQSTLGALRTALVLAHLQQAVNATKPLVFVQQRNPFLLLKEVPTNYAGEFGALHIEAVAPGSWVFDPDCSCIGYRPLYHQWLESHPDTQAVWFRVHGAPGPLQITAVQAHVWLGQWLN